MSSLLLATCFGIAALTPPATARAEDVDGATQSEVPPDRQPLDLPIGRGEETPAAEVGGAVRHRGGGAAEDAGEVAWAAPTAQQALRQRHQEWTVAAFGAAGAFFGFAGSFALVGISQPDPQIGRGWLIAAGIAGGLSAIALTTGTVLWLTTPPAAPDVAVDLGPGRLTLAIRF